jgi:hypothetical protein
MVHWSHKLTAVALVALAIAAAFGKATPAGFFW